MNSVLFAVYSFLFLFSSSPWAAVPHRWPSGLIEKNPKKKKKGKEGLVCSLEMKGAERIKFNRKEWNCLLKGEREMAFQVIDEMNLNVR